MGEARAADDVRKGNEELSYRTRVVPGEHNDAAPRL